MSKGVDFVYLPLTQRPVPKMVLIAPTIALRYE